MRWIHGTALLGGAACIAGCPSLFLPPNAATSVPLREGGASSPMIVGPIVGHYRVKLFDRSRTKDFDFNLDQAGRYVFGRVAPLNEEAPPKWAFDGQLSTSPAGDTATMSLVVTLGSTTSAEPATTSLNLDVSFAAGDFSLIVPAPSPLPTPTPLPTAPPGSSGGVVAVPAPAKVAIGAPGQAFVGTWSEGGQATGSVTALKLSAK